MEQQTAAERLQGNLTLIEQRCKQWRVKVNEAKSTKNFATKNEPCSPGEFKNKEIPQSDVVKHLGIHLDRRLTWRKHVETKRKQLNRMMKKMY